jgi:hypothetical protein
MVALVVGFGVSHSDKSGNESGKKRWLELHIQLLLASFFAHSMASGLDVSTLSMIAKKIMVASCIVSGMHDTVDIV